MESVSASVTTSCPVGGGSWEEYGSRRTQVSSSQSDLGRQPCCLAFLIYSMDPVLTAQCAQAWVGQGMEKGPGH